MDSINPYQSPCAPLPASQGSRAQSPIGRNIRAICILYIVLGYVAVVGGAAMFFEAVGHVPQVAGILVLGLGLGGIMSAIGVLRRKRWGVPLCQLVSVLCLLSFPLGTFLGGYFLLNIRKVKW